jgi:hypothetical protein
VAIVKGGDKLPKALAELGKMVTKAAKLRVGFLEKARYPDGTPVAMIAAINEYGAPSRGQPPRPFFRRMISAKQNEWAPAIADLLKSNGMDAEKALELAGAAIAGQLRQSITDLVDPPLAPSTIAKKGFDKPLIDTGQMLSSVDHEVKSS